MATYHINNNQSNIHALAADDSMYIHEGGVVDSLIVNKDSAVYVSEDGTLSDLTVENSGTAYILTGGQVSGVMLKADGLLSVEADAEATGIEHRESGRISAVVSAGTILSGTNENGDFSIRDGIASGLILYSGCVLTVKAGYSAVNISVQRKGRLEIEAGASASDIVLSQYSAFHASISAADGTVFSGQDGSGRTFSIQNGAADGFCLYNGSRLTVKGDGTAANITIYEGGSLLLAESGAAARNVTIASGSVLSLTVSGTVLENVTAAGTVRLGENITVDARNSIFTFELSGRKTKDGAILNRLDGLLNVNFTVSVSATQTTGIYKLAESAATFAGEIALTVGGQDTALTLTAGHSVVYAGRTYTLRQEGTGLNLEIVPPDLKILSADQNSAAWTEQSGAASYHLEISRNSGFSSVLRLETAGTEYDFFNLPEGSCYLRLKAGDVCSDASTFAVSGTAGEPEQILSEANGTPDLFFASSNETWSENYIARHTGTLSQRGTYQQVEIGGKNRFRDVFSGSGDANILCLTDSSNGDALFFDDIYSEYGGAGRLSQLNEICAGAGDDLIDLTSKRYSWNGKENMVVRTGDGNDVIWANSGTNRLFGDAGNDWIIGGGGKDLIAGGSGDDILNGGGGDDLFVFGGDWGNDTVEQRFGGSVALWFEDGSLENWDAGTMTYTDGENSVKITGVSANQVSFYFGTDAVCGAVTGSELAELGAFGESSSSRVWEQLA